MCFYDWKILDSTWAKSCSFDSSASAGRNISAFKRYEAERCDCALDTLATIWITNAKRREALDRSLEWLSVLHREGATWQLFPTPSNAYLYPNMTRHESLWEKAKKHIAQEIHELTSVWFCGVKQRRILFAKDITRWDDSRCSAEAMGFKAGSKRQSIIDKMLQVHRSPATCVDSADNSSQERKDEEEKQPSQPITTPYNNNNNKNNLQPDGQRDKLRILPSEFSVNLFDWQEEGFETFLDIEFVSSIADDFSNFPNICDKSCNCIIGAMYEHPETKKKDYLTSSVGRISHNEERRSIYDLNSLY